MDDTICESSWIVDGYTTFNPGKFNSSYEYKSARESARSRQFRLKMREKHTISTNLNTFFHQIVSQSDYKTVHTSRFLYLCVIKNSTHAISGVIQGPYSRPLETTSTTLIHAIVLMEETVTKKLSNAWEFSLRVQCSIVSLFKYYSPALSRFAFFSLAV